MFNSRLVPFFFMLVVYFLTMGLYYNQTHSIIISETEKKIKDILLSQRALSELVRELQKPEVYRLQNEGIIHKGYFSPVLLSSSYITVRLNEYANTEREKLGLAPLIYRHASPNPINPKNLATISELKIYEQFQNKTINDYKKTISQDGKEYLYYAIAGKIMEAECLQCHGLAENAPSSLIEQYGSKNGFGYKEGELSSIISIKAPLDDIYKESDRRFFTVAMIIFLLFILLLFTAERIKAHLDKKEKEVQRAYEIREESLKKNRVLESSLEKLYDHIISLKFNMQGNLIEVSSTLCRLSGYSREELIGKTFYFFNHPDRAEELFKEIWKALMSGNRWKGELKCLTKKGEVFWLNAEITPLKDENNIIFAFESIMRDITEKKTLLNDINIDPLTSLLNRRSFEKCFAAERARAKRDKKYFALVMIDIDFFKKYNDRYGHHKGDEALQRVSASLRNSFQRSSDFIFRLGGEEFAVVTSDSTIHQIVDAAHNACLRIRQEKIKHTKSDIDQFLTVSIGLAIVFHTSTLNLNEIYEQSDACLYKAKKKGRNRMEYIEL